MKGLFIELSRYLFVFLFVYYTYVSYRGATVNNEQKRKTIYTIQSVILFLIHFMGYLNLYLQNQNMNYLVLYVAQVIFFVAGILLYRTLYPKASKLLVNNMCMLMAIGFIMIARLSYDKCLRQFLIAVAGMMISLTVPWMLKKIRMFKNMAWIYCIIGIALLFSILMGNKIFGANLTLTLGPVSVQPAEFVKISYVLFIASMFHKSVSFKQITITAVIAAIHVIILVAANDLGAALIYFVIYLMMLYAASKKPLYMLAGLAAGSGAAAIAYQMFSHVQTRVQIWLDPWSTIDTTGYQIAQSLFSIGMGSWFGAGLYQGMPQVIPIAEKDFMISVISEEFGVIFAICVILVCLNCFILMMNIASMCKTAFYRLVAIGLAVTYGFQVFLTVGGAIKLIPLTGVTLPFVSYGGSSILSSLILFALINGMYIMRQNEGEHSETEKTSTKKADIKEKITKQ